MERVYHTLYIFGKQKEKVGFPYSFGRGVGVGFPRLVTLVFRVFFVVAGYESELNIQKFKIWDAIWWTKIQKAISNATNDSLWHTFFR